MLVPSLFSVYGHLKSKAPLLENMMYVYFTSEQKAEGFKGVEDLQ